jgi:hypothetical protein
MRCGKSFKKANYIDCKIIEFEVKRRTSFASWKTWSINSESSWLKTFALHKLEAFDVMLRN